MRLPHGAYVIAFPALCLLFALNVVLCNAANPTAGQEISTPEAATETFYQQQGLKERLQGIQTMAGVFMDVGRYPELAAKLDAAPVAQGAEWQRLLFHAQLSADMGDFDTAKKWLAQIPAPARATPEYTGLAASVSPPATTPAAPQAPAGFYAVRAALHVPDPPKVMAIITADPEQMLADPEAWAELTPALRNQNLVFHLIPIVRERVSKQPDNWKLRLLLAQYEIFAFQDKEAQADLWYLVNQHAALPAIQAWDNAEEVTDSMAALWVIYFPHMHSIGGQVLTDPLHEKVHSLRNARDLALYYLGGFAAETNGVGEFWKRVEAVLPKDNVAERIFALYLTRQSDELMHELRSYLDSGAASPVVDANGRAWINTLGLDVNHTPDMGSTPGERMVSEFVKRAQAKAAAVSPGGPASFSVPAALKILDDASKANDDALTKKAYEMLDHVASMPNIPPTMFLFQRYGFAQTANAFYADATAYALAKSVSSTSASFVKCRAFSPTLDWVPMGLYLPTPGEPPGPKAFSRDSRPSLTFFNQSRLNFSESPMGRGNVLLVPLVTPEVYVALDRLAADSSSPLKNSARMAKAYQMFFDPAKSDDGLALMKQCVADSPTDLGRFWLASMLVDRRDYAGARAQIDAIPVLPGYYTAFMQNARDALQRVSAGQPIYSPRPAPVIVKPGADLAPADISVLFNKFQQLSSTGQNDPAARQQATALANEILWLFPPECRFPERPSFLAGCQKIGLLPAVIQQYEAAAVRQPGSSESWDALGDACALSDHEKALSAYQRAFAVASEKTEIAKKICALTGISDQEKIPFYTLLAEKLPGMMLGREVIKAYQGTVGLSRFADALITGMNEQHWAPPADQLENLIHTLQQNNENAAAERITFAACSEPGVDSWGYGNVIYPFFESLVSQGRAQEAAIAADHFIFQPEPPPQIGVTSPPRSVLSGRDNPRFLVKAKSYGILGVAKDHARQILAKTQDDWYAREVLLAILVLDHDPAFLDEVKPYIEEVKKVTAPGNPFFAQRDANGRLWHMGIFAARDIELAPAVFDLLELAQKTSADEVNTVAITVFYADTALSQGNDQRARQALEFFMKSAEAGLNPDPQRGRYWPAPQWLQGVPLLLRAGMTKEARQCYDWYKNYHLQLDHALPVDGVLSYMRAAIDHGDVAEARTVADDLQQAVAAEVADRNIPANGRGQWPPYGYLQTITETLVDAGLAERAPQILDGIDSSWRTADNPGLRSTLLASRQLLDKLNATRLRPAVFFDRMANGEVTFWWDNGAIVDTSQGGRPAISTKTQGLDLPPGDYTLRIFAGKSEDQLRLMGETPLTGGRGSWSGKAAIDPAEIRAARAVVSQNGKEIASGPVVPIVIGENKLADPDFEAALKGDKPPTPAWIFEGMLVKCPGPIPERNAVSYPVPLPIVDTTMDVRGARIPVAAAESYFQSGWIRCGSKCDPPAWGRRYLDANGKELGVTFCNMPAAEGWVFTGQQLRPRPEIKPMEEEDAGAPAPAQGAEAMGDFHPDYIPAGTAFIEPLLRFQHGMIGFPERGMAQWSGLSLCSFTPAPPSIVPRPAEAIPPQPGEMPDAPTVFYKSEDDPAAHFFISRDSKSVIVGGRQGVIHKLDYPSGRELAKIPAFQDTVLALDALPGADDFAAVDEKGDVHVLSFSPEVKDNIVYASQRLRGAAVIPDRKWVALAGYEHDDPLEQPPFMEIASLETGKRVARFPLTGTLNANRIAATADKIQVWNDEVTILSWELPSFKPLPVQGPQRPFAVLPRNIPQDLTLCSDPVRKWSVHAVQFKLAVENAAGGVIWSFGLPEKKPASAAINSADGGILVLFEDATLWRYVVPERALKPAPVKP